MNSEALIRTHNDTWASVRVGDFMYLCGILEGDVSNPSGATCCIVDMVNECIVAPSQPIIDMARAQTDDYESSDDVLMYEFARREYI